jgi:hypothetical protein
MQAVIGGERRSSSRELPIRLMVRTRSSILDEGSSSGCLTAGSSGGHHACSPSKSRPWMRSRVLRCFRSDLENPARHALSDGSVSQNQRFRHSNPRAATRGGLKEIVGPVVLACCSTRPSLLPPIRHGRHRSRQVGAVHRDAKNSSGRVPRYSEGSALGAPSTCVKLIYVRADFGHQALRPPASARSRPPLPPNRAPRRWSPSETDPRLCPGRFRQNHAPRRMGRDPTSTGRLAVP